MTKPQNPYQKGSMIWKLYEGDWADLTAAQIGEVLGTTRSRIHNMMYEIKRGTGWKIHRLVDPAWKSGRHGKAREKGGRYQY